MRLAESSVKFIERRRRRAAVVDPGHPASWVNFPLDPPPPRVDSQTTSDVCGRGMAASGSATTQLSILMRRRDVILASCDPLLASCRSAWTGWLLGGTSSAPGVSGVPHRRAIQVGPGLGALGVAVALASFGAMGCNSNPNEQEAFRDVPRGVSSPTPDTDEVDTSEKDRPRSPLRPRAIR